MKFGIIGSKGFIAEKHRQAIADIGGHVIAEADINTPLNWKDVIDSKAEVISICTPNYLHARMATYAHEKGKKVILEKPISITLEDAEELAKLDNIAVCYQRRFDTQAQMIKSYPRKPYLIVGNIEMHRDPIYWDTWRQNPRLSGGGNLFNIQIHYLDLLIWWLGDKYKIEECKIKSYDRVIDESMSAVLRFDNTLVVFRGTSKSDKRTTEFKAFYSGEIFTYDIDDGTHTDVYDNFLNKGKYISTAEAYKSLKLTHDLYKFAFKK